MNGFTFFENYYKAINDSDVGLTEEEQGKLYNAIFAYVFRGEEPKLKGASKFAFTLIAGDIQREMQTKEENRENGRRGGRPKKTPVLEDPKGGFEIEKGGYSEENPRFENEKGGFEEKEVFLNEKEEGKERSKEKSEERDYILQEKDIPPDNPPTDTDGTVVTYLKFRREHPEIQEDITNPSLIETVDWELMGKKIGESRYLQTRKSLKWLLRNYSEIIGDSYKDFPSAVLPDIAAGKGDLQLWREAVNAVRRAKEERWCEIAGREIELFLMADEEAKREMGELYRGLSPEITAYFDPNSFLDLCKMDEGDLKFERARFLKALGGIRQRLAKETGNG